MKYNVMLAKVLKDTSADINALSENADFDLQGAILDCKKKISSSKSKLKQLKYAERFQADACWLVHKELSILEKQLEYYVALQDELF